MYISIKLDWLPPFICLALSWIKTNISMTKHLTNFQLKSGNLQYFEIADLSILTLALAWADLSVLAHPGLEPPIGPRECGGGPGPRRSRHRRGGGSGGGLRGVGGVFTAGLLEHLVEGGVVLGRGGLLLLPLGQPVLARRPGEVLVGNYTTLHHCTE